MNLSTEFFARRAAYYRMAAFSTAAIPVVVSGNTYVDVCAVSAGVIGSLLNFMNWPYSYEIDAEKEYAARIEHTARSNTNLALSRDGEHIIAHRYSRPGKLFRLWPFLGNPRNAIPEKHTYARFHAVEDAEAAHEFVSEARTKPEIPEAEKEAEILLSVLSGKKNNRRRLTK